MGRLHKAGGICTDSQRMDGILVSRERGNIYGWEDSMSKTWKCM